MKSLVLICFTLPFFLKAQEKTLQAVYLDHAPHIDGISDSLWQNLPSASGFTQYQTRPGSAASFPTKVKIGYDHTGIYLFARMHDNYPDSIFTETGQRDQENTNADEFSLILDTYNDNINGYQFTVTASGVQIEKRISSNGEDVSWNAVWTSRTNIDSAGWTVEMKIPFSAIRFLTGPDMTWGLNFARGIRRYREISFWNTVNPQISGLLNQAGSLTGLKDIESPVRLSLTPYVATYLYNESAGGYSTSFSAGADLKYGINESFTLDVTLVPDFGQVQSDNLILNLSPFEVRYNEFRPFFTEGTELFNKGGFFYSRRVGGTPLYYQDTYAGIPQTQVIENPVSTQLINAVKLSGRTGKGLGIGVFNAVAAPSYMTFDTSGVQERLLTSPLTNYNVLVADQSLKNNSYISLVNTNVTRSDKAYDSNVTGGLFRLVNKANTLSVTGKGAVSALLGLNNSNGEKESITGHEAGLTMAKISGRLNASVNYLERSDDYDINDLGYLAYNNIRETSAKIGYSIFKPFWELNYLHNNFTVGYSSLYHPADFYKMYLQLDGNTTFTKWFLTTGYTLYSEPVPVVDHFQARIPGYATIVPENHSASMWISSDYRKKIALDIRGSYRWYNEPGRKTTFASISPRWRISNRVLLIFSEEAELAYRDIGFVAVIDNRPVVGTRDVTTFTQTINGRFAFSPLMNLTLRLRHYWSQPIYESYAFLVPNAEREETGRELVYTDPGKSYDVSFNAVNMDLVYTWTFLPGSELNLTWKFAQLDSRAAISGDYFEVLDYLSGRPYNNSLSLKLLYYLDYQAVRNTLGKSEN